MKLFLSKQAQEALAIYKADLPDVADKIKTILQDALSHPSEGLGCPTKLEGLYANLWQRSFALNQTILYTFDEESIKILSIGTKETALSHIPLEAYSPEEEHSVMEQMSGNRGKDGEPWR